MSVTYSYTGTYDLGQLSDELARAGITVETIRGTPSAIDIVCADGTVEASVDAVEALHLAGTFTDQMSPLRVLDANANAADIDTAQPWFPSNGSYYVVEAGTFLFDGLLHIGRSTGTTSHTTSVLFGGTATVASIRYEATGNTGDTAGLSTMNAILGNAATAFVFKAASTSSTEVIRLTIHGIVKFSAAGTFIPQFKYSAAPGGTPSVQANSYFRMARIGSATVTNQGTWST